MIGNALKKVFGTKNDRIVKQARKVVAQINALEPAFEKLKDDELRAKTDEYKKRISEGESLDALLPEAFATVREASKRTLGMRHFDVQLIGGKTLHKGRISEMRTGEGKTLMSTLPAYLNALSGKGVHIVTVNDYLASRDANWMRPIYEMLGLTVGINLPGMPPQEKQKAYAADITYGTNNEFGFDYLRDNMAFSTKDKAQNHLNFAIVDEVDSILIDEARTPLIISGAAEDSSELYKNINALIPRLERQMEVPENPDDEVENPADFTVDEKTRQVHLTEIGQEKVESLLIEAKLLEEGDSLYSVQNITLLHHINAGLRAHHTFQRDVDYIVRDDKIIIVDEHTGRIMPGRRWGDGLHQAVEAKEKVTIQNESQTLASITFQNYFRLYNKLSGMTGTADTEAYEFMHIYGLEVVSIPTNKPMVRKDMGDLVYLTEGEKYDAIIEDIVKTSGEGRPVLVGTVSVESSERLSEVLKSHKIQHNVLNAKFHAKEAEIVAQAGRPGAVTIATNMAGRGTDIVLGGSWEAEVEQLESPTQEQIAKIKDEWKASHDQVINAGGLHIIGTERHESRRIDNQLRGRSGRQGDPGSTRFYLSLEDSLMRIFASDRVSGLMKKLGMEKGEAIEHPWVSKAIENAQRKVEGHNFDIRKSLLEYDDVANDQRKVVYEQRNELMSTEDISEMIVSIREDVVAELVAQYIPPQSLEEMWDVAGLQEALTNEFGINLPVQQWLDEDDNLYEEKLLQKISGEISAAYNEKEKNVGAEGLRHLEKMIMLQTLDALWKEHLAAMDHLRQGIHLRGYAQKNPKQEYKREAFDLFNGMLTSLKHDVVTMLSRVQIRTQEEIDEAERRQRELAQQQEMELKHQGGVNSLAPESDNEPQAAAQAPVRRGPKVGRNDPCPCGSGKKYKQCHGKIA